MADHARLLGLTRVHCCGFREVQLWGDGEQRANLLLARAVSIAAAEPCSLVRDLQPSLGLIWAYGQRFCCEPLFRDQTSGIVQPERSGLRDPARRPPRLFR